MDAVRCRLRDVLDRAREFAIEQHVYLPRDVVWDLETVCLVLGESDVDGVPAEARRLGLDYALGMAAVVDIIENAREQLESVTLDQLLRAFLFYYDWDAFMEFGAA